MTPPIVRMIEPTVAARSGAASLQEERNLGVRGLLAFSSDSPRWSLGGTEGLTRTACFRCQVRSALWSSLASCTRDWMLSFAKTEAPVCSDGVDGYGQLR